MQKSLEPPLTTGKVKIRRDRRSIDSKVRYENEGSDTSKSNHKLNLSALSQKLNTVSDYAANIFIRRRPNRYIDINEGFVTKEESEYRLLLLYISFTVIMGLVATSIAIACPFYCINPKIIYWKQSSKEIKGIVLMFSIIS